MWGGSSGKRKALTGTDELPNSSADPAEDECRFAQRFGRRLTVLEMWTEMRLFGGSDHQLGVPRATSLSFGGLDYLQPGGPHMAHPKTWCSRLRKKKKHAFCMP